jgi:hypothetical protein
VGGARREGQHMIECEFTAAVNKVQTLLDGGIRATFDMSEGSIPQAAELMAIRQAGLVIRCKCTAIEMPKRDEE